MKHMNDVDHINLYNMLYMLPINTLTFRIHLYSDKKILTSKLYSFHPTSGNIVQINAINTATPEIIMHFIT